MKAKSTLLSSQLQKAYEFQRRGNAAEAQEVFKKVLAVQPRNFDALYALAMIEAQQRRFHDAEELLRNALAIDPVNAAAHHSLGLLLKELDRLEDAIASFDRAIALRPRFAQAYFHRAMALKRLDRLEAALDSYDRVIAIQADNVDAYFNRGKVLCELKRLDAALESYDQAIAVEPGYAGAYCNRAMVLSALCKFDAAISSYDQAIALNPRDPIAVYNRGADLQTLNRLEDALASYNEAIALDPHFYAAHNNRGGVLRELNRFDAALASYDQAIVLNANLAEAYCGKGNVLATLGQSDAAIGLYDRAITIRSDFAVAQFGKAMALLSAGDFERGWQHYEWRWQKDRDADLARREAFRAPPWLGQESIAGRSIILYREQGLGDAIQFCRYATLVANLGARVILEVPQSLVTLAASVEGVSQVVVSGTEPLPDFQFHCPLLSLPLALKTTLDTVPAPLRYFHTPTDKIQFWREKLAPSATTLKVGLVWSGGFRPHQPEAWSTLDRRNIPLAHLVALRHPDIEFFSLQVGQPAAGDIARLAAQNWEGPTIIDYTNLLTDFADTAGLIDNLDLVIAVDTSTAHLAGALGKPVWILNRFDSCWRWLLHREDSPWYPSVTLYRQPSPGDWRSVIRRVRADLFKLLT